MVLFIFLSCNKHNGPQSAADKIAGGYFGFGLYIPGNLQVYTSDTCLRPQWGALQGVSKSGLGISYVNDSTIYVESQGLTGNLVIHENGNIISDTNRIIIYTIDKKGLTMRMKDTFPSSACVPLDPYYYVKQEMTGNPPTPKLYYYSVRTWNFDGEKYK